MVSPAQAELLELIQAMPVEDVLRVLHYARTLKGQPSADYTEDWMEEEVELRAAANETLRRLDEIDPYDWPDEEGAK